MDEAKIIGPIDIEKIISMIPHRYPFLLVDRVLQCIPGEIAIGLKNVSINEQFFQGHFPSKAIMPGVLIIESMAQTSAILVAHTLGDEAKNKLVYFMSIDKAKFRKPVVPGDSVLIHVQKIRNHANVWKFEGIAKVNEEKVAEACFTAMIIDKDKA